MPIARVEDSWQIAEFYNNKILVEYKNKDPNHVEWAKALKDLYVPGLRDYVKSQYPLGPVWSAIGKTIVLAPSKAHTTTAPAPPPPPPSSLFISQSPQSSSSRPKEGMSAVFQEINSGKPATAGLRKVTDDMKTKNRTDRTGIVGASEKESHGSSRSFSKAGPPKLELQMGRKWVVENQIGKKNLVIDDCDAKQTVYIFGCKGVRTIMAVLALSLKWVVENQIGKKNLVIVDCDAKQTVYIFGCKDYVLQIQGKVNNITVDKCTKMGIVFTVSKVVVAAFEIVLWDFCGL
ncbi:F-actin-capping protein subunit alpha [Sarracenia purpurea var. burkii]